MCFGPAGPTLVVDQLRHVGLYAHADDAGALPRNKPPAASIAKIAKPMCSNGAVFMIIPDGPPVPK